MAARSLCGVVTGEHCLVKIYYTPDYSEFYCRLAGQPEADYFTQDYDDAMQSAEAMAKAYDERINDGTCKST